jgi:hypothetical protein
MATQAPLATQPSYTLMNSFPLQQLLAVESDVAHHVSHNADGATLERGREAGRTRPLSSGAEISSQGRLAMNWTKVVKEVKNQSRRGFFW